MFYSQFILAKKGPLGTIWIAAHLERKLRKNQVADTDIGVSVDSIIFPDVPIALRLSSHLLLGVVRIYSRKVNYLFDDCSEALLKIKQAFRSTAVDLPPEESTAPYHSITLPETFDLDDFELPDQELLQGTYIDHHISNKEQITLQDTMDDVIFSTSQFGLDERFGDGDASQIGLDLEEDLLLNKLPAAENSHDAMDLDLVHNTSGHHVESVINANDGEVEESAKLVQAKQSEPEAASVIPNVSVDGECPELIEYAQAPATPGLVEEPNLSNQKASASDDLVESEKHQPETVTNENLTETFHSAPPDEDMVVNLGLDAINTNVKDHLLSEKKNEQSNLENSDVALGEACAMKILSDQPCLKVGDIPENSAPLLSNGYQLDEQGIMHPETSINITVSGQVEESPSPKNELASNGLVSESPQVLHACNSNVSMHDNLSNGKVDPCDDLPLESPPLDKSEVMRGDAEKLKEMQPAILSGTFKVTDTASDSVSDMNQSADSHQQVQINHSELNNRIESSITKHSNEVSFPSPTSELPAPERLLSVPEPQTELPSDLLPDSTTPAKVLSATDENGTGVSVTTGKKRSFTESTLTADNTAESSGLDRLGKTAESIPDDEDLLSSILVGRRSSILKLKPTPTQTELISVKRPKVASRSVTYKRKVLMDDAMVLHGDTIREQLVSTEDIRRVRKKAPCTRQEIWMVQKQFLEEDIVYDPVSTGMSMELVCLHNQAYELSEISITNGDESTIPTHPSLDENAIPDTHDGVVKELNAESQLGPSLVEIEKQSGEADTSCVGHDSIELQKVDSAASVPLPPSLEQASVFAEMEVDGERVAVAEVTEPASSAIPIESSSPACVIPADNAETNAECNVPLAEETNKCGEVYTEVSSLNQSSKEEVDHSHVTAIADGNDSLLHLDSETIKELSAKEAVNDERVEDIDFSRSLAAKETHVLETMENGGNNEACPSHSVDHDIHTEKLSPTGVHNEISYEFDDRLRQANGTTDTDSAFVTEDYNGMNYMTAEHDTGFLNVDDEDLEVDESFMPSVEENRTRIVDDSGWSSRSRAVGKYLQIMFDKEAEHGKNTIPVDKLLAGKSRKEASRMFFETLVLKTRDYIDVEQTNPFNNINLRPQSMLMKSDF